MRSGNPKSVDKKEVVPISPTENRKNSKLELELQQVRVDNHTHNILGGFCARRTVIIWRNAQKMVIRIEKLLTQVT